MVILQVGGIAAAKVTLESEAMAMTTESRTMLVDDWLM